MDNFHTLREIKDQSEAWEKALNVTATFPQGTKPIVFFGAGVATAAANTLAWATRAILKRPAFAVSSQDIFTYDNWVDRLGAGLFVSISRTGDVTDNIRAAKIIKNNCKDIPLVGIIGETGGELGSICDSFQELEIMEESIATTKTISSIILCGQTMLYNTAGKPADDLRRLPELFHQVVPIYESLINEVKDQEYDQIVFLGSGPLNGIAEASAIAALEMAVEKVGANQPLVYLHGPRVTTSLYRTLIVTYLSAKGRDHELAALSNLANERVTLVTVGEQLEEKSLMRNLNTGLSDLDRSVLLLPLGQLLGAHRAIARGYNPDRPPNLPKVF